jgi:hypothetical protein
VAPLPISEPHYGQTYAEWASAWWTWVYTFNVHGSACDNPVTDTTGALCADSQDPSSAVFFLAGTFGGKSIRSACTVPAGKALFFPILNAESDNGDVTPPLTLAQNQAVVQAAISTMITSSFVLDVDGASIPGLDQLLVPPTEFSYVEEAPPNVYTCDGQPTFSGPVPGAVQGGYYVLRPPLSAGAHTIHFAGAESNSAKFSLDVTYDLTVE